MNGNVQYAEPSISVQTCDNTNGYAPNLWKVSSVDNTKTLAGILTDGLEGVIIHTGDEGTTLTFRARGPPGTGEPMTGSITIPAYKAVYIAAGTPFNARPPPGASLEMEVVSGSAFAGLRYTDEATQSHSWRDMSPFETATPVDQYNSTVEIIVYDDGTALGATATGVSDATMKKLLGTTDLSYFPGVQEFFCYTFNKVDPLIDNYNSMTLAEQNEVSDNNATELVDYYNDSDGDGLACDTDEPDKKWAHAIITTITPK
jgi:hypothetical protein